MLFKKKKAHDTASVDMLKIIDDKTTFAIREAFNSLCANILYLPIEDKCKKIAVTSSLPGEGKTYISINLAITLAQNLINKKVLLIDMDMRNPSIANLFKNYSSSFNSTLGLSEYLVGLSETPNIVETNVSGLSVLFSGGESTNPAGLINSEKMTAFIKECEDSYDYIIIDTPPVNVVTDSTLLVNLINGYIIATRSDYSTINSLENVEETLNAVGATVFGVVLTGYNPKKTKKYGKYYSDYSKYYN